MRRCRRGAARRRKVVDRLLHQLDIGERVRLACVVDVKTDSICACFRRRKGAGFTAHGIRCAVCVRACVVASDDRIDRSHDRSRCIAGEMIGLVCCQLKGLIKIMIGFTLRTGVFDRNRFLRNRISTVAVIVAIAYRRSRNVLFELSQDIHAIVVADAVAALRSRSVCRSQILGVDHRCVQLCLQCIPRIVCKAVRAGNDGRTCLVNAGARGARVSGVKSQHCILAGHGRHIHKL